MISESFPPSASSGSISASPVYNDTVASLAAGSLASLSAFASSSRHTIAKIMLRAPGWIQPHVPSKCTTKTPISKKFVVTCSPQSPFVPALPEVAMRRLRMQCAPYTYEGNGSRNGPQMSGSGPMLHVHAGFRKDPECIRSSILEFAFNRFISPSFVPDEAVIDTSGFGDFLRKPHPVGPFLPEPPESAMMVLGEHREPFTYEGEGGRDGPQANGLGPMLRVPAGFHQDPGRMGSGSVPLSAGDPSMLFLLQ